MRLIGSGRRTRDLFSSFARSFARARRSEKVHTGLVELNSACWMSLKNSACWMKVRRDFFSMGKLEGTSTSMYSKLRGHGDEAKVQAVQHIHLGLEKLSHSECILGGGTEVVWPHGGAIHLAGQQNASRSVHLDGDFAGHEGTACSRVDERVQVVERECGALVGEPELEQGLWWGRANA